MVTQLTEKFRRKLEQMAQYTEKAQEALVLASEAAEDMGSPVIGTEHILVGLIEEGSGTAAMVLEANEVKLDRLLALVEQLVSSYQNTATKERDGYTPSARHVLENGYKEAVRFRAYSDGIIKGIGLCGSPPVKHLKYQHSEGLHRPFIRHG